MPDFLEEESGQVRRRQRKMERQRLLEEVSEPDSLAPGAPSSSKPHSKAKAKRHGKTDRGKAFDKAQRELVRKKRQTSKLELKMNGVKTLNNRKKNLAKVSLFAILAMHKMDKRLIHLASNAVRECLLLMFVHHLILRGEIVRRLVLGKMGDRVLPAHAVPIVHNDSMLRRQKSVQSRVVSTSDLQVSVAHNIEQAESRVKDDKVLSNWLKWAVKTFASSLKISTEDSMFQRVLKSVEHHVDKLINPEDTLKGKSKKSYRARMAWKYTASGSNRKRFYPLLFNPQPLKRFFTTFVNVSERLILEAVENEMDGAAAADHDGSGVIDPLDLIDAGRQERVKAPSVNKTSIQSMKNIVSRTFNESARSLSAKASGLSSMEKSVLDPSISIEEIDRLIARDVERMEEAKTSNALHSFIHDFAERMRHLPSRLCANLKRAATETVEVDLTAGDSPTADAPRSVPIMGAASPWSLPSNHSPETIRSMATPSQPEKDLATWTSSESENDNESVHVDGSASSGVSSGVSSGLDIALNEGGFIHNPLNGCPALSGQEFFELIPLHIILLWEVIISLLQSGSWDSGFEEVIRQTAISLDVDPELFDALVAYAADLVAEAVANEMKTHTTTKPVSETSSATTDDSHRQTNTKSESRTLATTTPHTLRVNGSINKERVLRIAGMALGVGALSALTAGLAAPAFAAGFGALGIAGTSGIATFLGSASGAASLASLFGASSASLSGWKYSRRLADIRVFEFVHLSMNCIIDAVASFVGDVMDSPDTPPLGTSHLFSTLNPNVSQRTLKPPFGIIIGISGWLNSIEDATRPWWFLADRLGTELFALKWEPQLLTELGTMMIRLVGENVAYSAASFSVQMTMAASAGLIMWPVSLLQYAGQLDNTWMTCRERAQQAGYLLALALCDTSLVGHRPVTLVGYSVGSRVITYCLRELYNKGEFNRVKDVVVMGLPGSKVRDVWRKMRSVVSGRLINVYCTSDWILAFLYRWMEWGVQVAGLSAIEDVPGVENFDATAIVVSHNNYEKRIPEILSLLNIHTSLLNKDDIESISGNSNTD